ncbi:MULTISPECIES: 3-dehydro-L-gulonate 2-dehydrogenase [Halanaerobium]|jgi:3-dehydro-L-gulonate 2-dehydrogenase|uniref:3-dehydro-L-gulonate 2-dehydrogenase n=1 Tax=Halanaerobium kushneri TaxID=56779 RepID=A0A1N6VKU0_9FIRM|nr:MULTISPECIES: 3-dehydro-L-gulonate 2-dehydrogenase [Halanaerobium]RCW56496.1 3-dehydro-L-gulonate 2-dehydrogenase [Halanaerobium sp. ST460_2HS_T2]SIQ78407.1 3-dehydro-L-gulonate 2-dehydrogenase [Halanaerobium kushneri]
MRLEYSKLYDKFLEILLNRGFAEVKAKKAAKNFADSSLDGFQSHGVNRFPRFIEMIDQGYIDIEAEAELVDRNGNIEIYDGHLGPGNLNAQLVMEKAIKKAKKEGIAVMALRNTNHWMRGGAFGWQAAEAGCAAICFTNTLPNLPPWGAKECKIGNNPLVMAIPRQEKHIVLDMAVSQYAYGKLEQYAMDDRELPYPGGYNKNGELTTNPKEILEAVRPIPTGYWKGSGLSIMLDLFASLLSNGLDTFLIGQKEREYALSQLFLVFDMEGKIEEERIEETIDSIHSAERVDPEARPTYPGERTYLRRQENREKGIPVNEEVWEKIKSL